LQKGQEPWYIHKHKAIKFILGIPVAFAYICILQQNIGSKMVTDNEAEDFCNSDSVYVDTNSHYTYYSKAEREKIGMCPRRRKNQRGNK